MSIGVVYLERSANNPHWSKQFFKSLMDNDLGHDDAELIFIRKGNKWPPTYFNSPIPFKTFDIEDKLYTFGSVRPVIEKLDHEKIVFFNSFSKILAPKWLKTYVDAMKPDVGIVGATGSLENNPHIRGNAWMMDRRLWLEMTVNYKMDNRDDEHLTECGPDSITQRILKNGMKAIVVDRHNGNYEDFGATANIFRRGFQQDLLVQCNRTYAYDIAHQEERCYLSSLAWGMESLDHGSVPSTTIEQRIESYTRWNYDL